MRKTVLLLLLDPFRGELLVLTIFLKTMDKHNKEYKSPQARRQTKDRVLGPPSTRSPPVGKDVPDWALIDLKWCDSLSFISPKTCYLHDYVHVFLLISLALCGTCIYWLYNALTADHKNLYLIRNLNFMNILDLYQWRHIVFQIVDFA